MNLEESLKTMLETRARGVAATGVIPQRTMRRVLLRKALMTGGTAAVAAALVMGGFSGARSLLRQDAAPVPPAEQHEQETPLPNPGVNGRILSGDRGFWTEDTSPPPPGTAPYYIWDAFDQDTGSFLFISRPDPRVAWVVGGDQTIAEFDCAGLGICNFLTHNRGRFAFGPGPNLDVVTVPWDDQPQSAMISALDGKGGSCCFSPPLVQGQEIADLAWSPDGRRLAIAAHFPPDYVCEGDVPCEVNVWISDRDRPTWQVVYSERADDDWAVNGPPTIVDLAWSPDGRSVALVSAPDDLAGAVDKGVWPRLVAIRLESGQPPRSETLHVYDDYDWEKEEFDALVTDDDDLHFAFAWAPDATRIAVTSKGGIAEISAEDGHVLAEHPGDGVHGPLAWLKER